MNRTKKAALAGLLLAIALTALGFGWNYHHQRTLSPAVKAACWGAMYNTDSRDVDTRAYLRAAQLACRTKKDRKVVGRLDAIVKAVHDYQDFEQHRDEQLTNSSYSPEVRSVVIKLNEKGMAAAAADLMHLIHPLLDYDLKGTPLPKGRHPDDINF